MATKKISELEAINAAEDNDVLVIVDTSESTTNKITKGNLLIGAGHSIELELNSETYQLTLTLKNAAGNILGTPQTIDLPNENAITNIEYNNGKLTITKQSGATSQVDISGLIEGLVTESDFNTFKEALQTILEAINEKDTEQDEAIAENYKVINKLNEKLEDQQKVIDQLPQVTGQGTEIILENTIEAQFTKFDVEGNSEQESTKGYQLLSYLTKGTKSYGGINLKIDENGYLYITGSNTYTSYITLLSFTMVANQAYTIDETGCTNDLKISWANVNTFTSDAHRTYTPTVDTETAIQLIIPANTNYNNYKMKIFLYKGSYDSGKKLEPYTGGIASPNSNYEQPIESAGDDENLFDIETSTAYQLCTKSDDVFTTSAMTRFAVPKIKLGVPLTVINGTDYYISYDVKTNSGDAKKLNYYGRLSEDAGLNITTNFGELIGTFTMSNSYQRVLWKTTATSDFTANYLFLQATSEITNAQTISIKNIKISEVNTKPYSPYGMGSINEKIKNADGTKEQDYSIFVQQPMRSIRDVRDCFVKKSDGWYERHYILRKIFDGTENWVYSYNNFVLARQSVNTHLANSECLSNSYIYSSTALSGEYGIRTGNADFIQIRDTNYDNVTDFKAMLAEKYANGTPVYVDYILAEPLDLPCTEEQIQQLENKPSTYKDFTTINSEDETPAYLKVSGIRDIDTMFDKVTNAIVSLGGNV